MKISPTNVRHPTFRTRFRPLSEISNFHSEIINFHSEVLLVSAALQRPQGHAFLRPPP